MICQEMQGKKTYTVAFLIAALAAGYANGYVDEQLYNALLVTLNAAGLATLRAGISKEEVVNEIK